MSNKETWEKNIASEVSFWEEWTKTQGSQWKEEYKTRLDPDSKLQDIFLSYLDRNVSKNRILDVGAGPLTIINKKCEYSELEIQAVDPLADAYDDLLKKYNVQPIVRTQKCDGERLTEKLGENGFEIAYSRNALDHSYDPLKCIEEMIKAAKKDGYIILQVFNKEGSRERWHGLHKWNFFISREFLLWGRADLYLQGRRTSKINVTDSLKDSAQMVRLEKQGKEITVVFKKKLGQEAQ